MNKKKSDSPKLLIVGKLALVSEEALVPQMAQLQDYFQPREDDPVRVLVCGDVVVFGGSARTQMMSWVNDALCTTSDTTASSIHFDAFVRMLQYPVSLSQRILVIVPSNEWELFLAQSLQPSNLELATLRYTTCNVASPRRHALALRLTAQQFRAWAKPVWDLHCGNGKK